jgi:hypothetical protein
MYGFGHHDVMLWVEYEMAERRERAEKERCIREFGRRPAGIGSGVAHALGHGLVRVGGWLERVGTGREPAEAVLQFGTRSASSH